MSDRVTFSLSEANYTTTHQPLPRGDRTLSDWILLLFYSDKRIPIKGFGKLMNVFFVTYNEIIKDYQELYINFSKNSFGVYSEDIEDIFNYLLANSFLSINESDDDMDKSEIYILEKGVNIVKSPSHLKEGLEEDFNAWRTRFETKILEQRRKWDGKSERELTEFVDILFPEYRYFMILKAEEWNKKGEQDLYESKSHDDAIMCFNKALALDSRYEMAWKHKGEALQELKRYSEAIACYNLALEINPKLAVAWNNRGVCFGQLKNYEYAIICFDKAIEIENKNPVHLTNKGEILSESGKDLEALAYFDEALETKFDDADIWGKKAQLLHKLKRYEEALHIIDKAMQLFPNNA